MNKIDLKECAEFQEIFWNGGVYSPYEEVGLDSEYFLAVVVGEIGTLLNAYLKQQRSPNDYRTEIGNDAADIFICFLIYILIRQRVTGVQLLSGVETLWQQEAREILTQGEFYDHLFDLVEKLRSLMKNEHDDPRTLGEIFIEIKAVGQFASRKDWQSIVDGFHSSTFNKFTDFERYSPDILYRGSCYVDFEKLIDWGTRNGAYIPPKRLLFLKRMAELQSSRRR